METNRIKKAMAILLAVMFLLTVTVGAASAWGCGGWGGCGSPKPMADSVKFTDKISQKPIMSETVGSALAVKGHVLG